MNENMFQIGRPVRDCTQRLFTRGTLNIDTSTLRRITYNFIRYRSNTSCVFMFAICFHFTTVFQQTLEYFVFYAFLQYLFIWSKISNLLFIIVFVTPNTCLICRVLITIYFTLLCLTLFLLRAVFQLILFYILCFFVSI